MLNPANNELCDSNIVSHLLCPSFDFFLILWQRLSPMTTAPAKFSLEAPIRSTPLTVRFWKKHWCDFLICGFKTTTLANRILSFTFAMRLDSLGLMIPLFYSANNFYMDDRALQMPENPSPRKALERKSLMLTQRQPISPRLCFPSGQCSSLQLP